MRIRSEIRQLRRRWQNLHTELSNVEAGPELAGLFLGHKPPGFLRHSRRILYIGKATAGPFNDQNASSKYFWCNQSAFWSFACRLSRRADPDCSDLTNLAWSNLCKIGTTLGNPGRNLVAAQRALAVETLQAEIAALRPTLVACVAANYLADDFIYDTLKVRRGMDGFEECSVGTSAMYHRAPRDGFPAMLWMQHPQGKSCEYLDRADQLAGVLLHGPV